MELLALLCLALIAVLPSNTEPALPSPSNVRIDSFNLRHVIRWDPVEINEESAPVKYTVEFEMDGQSTGTAEQNHKYMGRYSDCLELCVNITETECDFTGKILHFYQGKLRVRVEFGSRRSDWVVLPDFQPSKNTILGPVKSLVLRSHAGKLTLNFAPPFSPIPNGWTVKYTLYYWKETPEREEMVDLDSSTTYVLDRLEPNANYCVQVCASTPYIEGLMSDPVCETTYTANTHIVVLWCVFGVVLICGLLSLLVIPEKPVYKAVSRMKHWLDGPYKIPAHVMDYLEDPPPFVECTENTSVEHYDRLSVVGMDLCQDLNEETCQQGSEKT